MRLLRLIALAAPPAWALAAHIGVATLAAAPQAAAPATVLLRGAVIDAATGTGIRRARVEVQGGAVAPSGTGRVDAVMTDLEGRFSVSLPAGSQARVRIVKAGYAQATRQLSAADLRQDVPLLVALDRGAAITGRIVDQAGNPSDGGTTLLVRPQGEVPNASSPLRFVSINDRGEFRAGGLPAGRYTIDNIASLTAPGLRADGVDVQLEPGQEVPVVITFEPGATGTGGAVVVTRTQDGRTVTTAFGTPPPPARPVPSGVGRAIRGVVTTSTGAPVEGAAVIARKGSRIMRDTSDARGRFAVAGLEPGSYTVSATKRGFVAARHGQRGLDLPGSEIALTASEDFEDAAIVLTPAGAFSGMAYDEFGDPLEEAAVHVVRVRRSPEGLSPVGNGRGLTVRTDDRGFFRAEHLAPGEYIAAATLSAHVVYEGVRSTYATTYWPDAPDVRGAAPLEVRAGEEIGGLTFTMRLVPVVRVSGLVVNSADAPAAGTARLMRSDENTPGIETQTVELNASGEFAFDNVRAGEYVIHAVAPRGPKGSESGRRLITVTLAAPDPVFIRTSSGSSLRGRFVLEGGTGGELMWGYSASAVADGVPWNPATVTNLGSPIADGEPFSMSGLSGPTRLQIATEDSNWYLKAIIIDGIDAADEVFDFGFDGRSYTGADVVFSRLGATMAGRATDERGRPVTDYAVYVFPTERDRWIAGSRWVQVVRASADGTFRTRSMPPGTYWAVAVDRLDVAAAESGRTDAALLDVLWPQAMSVVVGEGETRDVVLRVVRR